MCKKWASYFTINDIPGSLPIIITEFETIIKQKG